MDQCEEAAGKTLDECQKLRRNGRHHCDVTRLLSEKACMQTMEDSLKACRTRMDKTKNKLGDKRHASIYHDGVTPPPNFDGPMGEKHGAVKKAPEPSTPVTKAKATVKNVAPATSPVAAKKAKSSKAKKAKSSKGKKGAFADLAKKEVKKKEETDELVSTKMAISYAQEPDNEVELELGLINGGSSGLAEESDWDAEDMEELNAEATEEDRAGLNMHRRLFSIPNQMQEDERDEADMDSLEDKPEDSTEDSSDTSSGSNSGQKSREWLAGADNAADEQERRCEKRAFTISIQCQDKVHTEYKACYSQSAPLYSRPKKWVDPTKIAHEYGTDPLDSPDLAVPLTRPGNADTGSDTTKYGPMITDPLAGPIHDSDDVSSKGSDGYKAMSKAHHSVAEDEERERKAVRKEIHHKAVVKEQNAKELKAKEAHAKEIVRKEKASKEYKAKAPEREKKAQDEANAKEASKQKELSKKAAIKAEKVAKKVAAAKAEKATNQPSLFSYHLIS